MYEYMCMHKCVCVDVVYTYVQTKVIIGIACDMTICIELPPGICIMISTKKYIDKTAWHGTSKIKPRLYLL